MCIFERERVCVCVRVCVSTGSSDRVHLRMYACIIRALLSVHIQGSFTCSCMTHSSYSFARIELHLKRVKPPFCVHACVHACVRACVRACMCA